MFQAPGALPKPSHAPKLMLDKQGRLVDEHGRAISSTGDSVATLKANQKARKNPLLEQVSSCVPHAHPHSLTHHLLHPLSVSASLNCLVEQAVQHTEQHFQWLTSGEYEFCKKNGGRLIPCGGACCIPS